MSKQEEVDYKEVLEAQIKELQKVQSQIIKATLMGQGKEMEACEVAKTIMALCVRASCY